MKYIQLFLLFVTFSMATSCNTKSNKNITNTKDYNSFLTVDENMALKTATEEYNFWSKKLTNTPNQYPYNAKLASANASIFKITGNIDELKKAEQNLIITNQKTNYNNAAYLRALARNYISQHRFKEALSLLKKAEKNGQGLTQTHLMLVDVYLELGHLDQVTAYLSKVKNFKDFNYLIRLSKYNDHIGDLDKAITYLEASLKIATASNNTYLMQWNYTNLADYYGHAGNIKDSYNAYLKALELDKNNSYAKKGIAWIVYSYERNPTEAMRILETITQENTSPDYHLLQAEIADYMGKIVEKENYINKYLSKVDDKKYGVMYHKYNVLLFADDDSKKQKALEIAQQEVSERPTAQSYDLLAWSLFKNGQKEKALEVAKKYVINKTFEPEALLHTAQILKANGKFKEANMLKKELLTAVYELGPLTEKMIINI
ncbi:tetratricopeptide repeat protein [Polaribacter sp.]|uniref:tetratricopeptide repeat protein n=1 Tax=Polaribacter sp. TaxID=1920175 RepID=UPI003EF6CCB0